MAKLDGFRIQMKSRPVDHEKSVQRRQGICPESSDFYATPGESTLLFSELVCVLMFALASVLLSVRSPVRLRELRLEYCCVRGRPTDALKKIDQNNNDNQ